MKEGYLIEIESKNPIEEQVKKLGKAYRYVDSLYSSGVEYTTYLKVNLYEYQILKETLKGIWIEDYFGHRKFVNLNSRKKFACLSKEDALISFKKRKERQVRLLESQLNFAKEALAYSQKA